MAAKRPTNPLALAVLSLLSERPMHPYEMSSTLKERAKEQSIKLNYGSLYAVVESLLKRGYIEARETIRDGRRPERTIYAITETGDQLTKEWLSELLSTPVKEFPQFEAALSLMPGLPPDEVIELLEQRLAIQSAKHQKSRALMDRMYAAGMPQLFAIEHEYEQALLKAEVEFLQNLIDDLRSEKITGIKGWRHLWDLRLQGLPFDEAWEEGKDDLLGDPDWPNKVRDLSSEQ